KYFATKSSLYAQTAVELDDAAVQVIVLEDEGGRVRDLGRLAEALQRDPGRDLREYLRLHRRDHLGLDEAGRDRVHADAVLAELLRPDDGQRGDAGFRGGVVALPEVAVPRDARDVDDAAAVAERDHPRGRLAAAEEYAGQVDVDDRLPLLERELV